MPLIKVTDGDLERGAWTFTTARRGCRMCRTTQVDWFRPMFIDFHHDVVAIEDLGPAEFEALARREAWAVSRGWWRRRLKALVETVTGQRNPDVGFVARLRDGRRFTAVTDRGTWYQLHAAVVRCRPWSTNSVP